MQNKKSSARREEQAGQWLSPDKFITEEPTKAMATALGVGLLLNVLPIGRIAGMLIDVAFALARPLLLCAGLLKVSEFCRSGTPVGGKTENK